MKLTDSEISEVFDRLFGRIAVLQPKDYAPALAQAYSIMKDVDEGDTPFLAAAIQLEASIWSNDKDFKRQNRIQVYNSSELIRILKRERQNSK